MLSKRSRLSLTSNADDDLEEVQERYKAFNKLKQKNQAIFNDFLGDIEDIANKNKDLCSCGILDQMNVDDFNKLVETTKAALSE